ncbi:hypothetical protein FRX31_031622, partial [Thalictrum thalictroides]
MGMVEIRVKQSKMDNILIFICPAYAGLVDLRYTGNFLTWCNKRDDRTWTKIDWVMVNNAWLNAFPDMEAEFLNPRTTSDHSAMLITPRVQVNSKRRAFIFFNFWTQEEGYHEVVTRAWRMAVVGFAVNTDKSQLFFTGVANAIKEDIINVLQYPVGELPV